MTIDVPDVAVLPPVELEAAFDAMTTAQRVEVLHGLDGVLAGLALVYGYADMRYGCGCGDQGHTSAVREANKVRRNVRNVLGFDVTRDIPF